VRVVRRRAHTLTPPPADPLALRTKAAGREMGCECGCRWGMCRALGNVWRLFRLLYSQASLLDKIETALNTVLQCSQ
jgi:hypothetical protein